MTEKERESLRDGCTKINREAETQSFRERERERNTERKGTGREGEMKGGREGGRESARARGDSVCMCV